MMRVTGARAVCRLSAVAERSPRGDLSDPCISRCPHGPANGRACPLDAV